MQLYDPKTLGAPNSGWFTGREKKRLVLLGIAFLLILGAVIAAQIQSRKRETARLEAAAQLGPQALPTEISVPTIDVAGLEAVADDLDPAHRVVLPGAVLEAGFAQSAQIYDGVYEPLGGRELTAALAAEMVRAPTQFRGQLFRVRCMVEEMREITGAEAPEDQRWFLRGKLEDGCDLFFAVKEIVGLAPVPGDFVRVDTLFARAHRAEVQGRWIDAPLLVGPRMLESFQKLAPVKELTPQQFLGVQDDSVARGFEGLGYQAYWELVSYVKHLEPGQVDWEQVPVLDNSTIMALFANGAEWRGKPVRIPVARMLAVWRQAQPENPLRVEHLVTGWFGRGDWVGQAKVASFVAPYTDVPPSIEKNFTARGYFFKNLGYVPKNGGAAIAPFFVLESMEEFIPPDTAGLRQIGYIVAGSLLVLALGAVIMVRRDRKASEALEAELLRRRRERRQKVAAAAKP